MINNTLRIPYKVLAVVLTFALACAAPALAAAVQASAKAQAVAATTAAQSTATWAKSKSGYWYCKVNGVRAKGLTKVSGKTYYFDGKGRQRVSWQKVKGVYRYFTPSYGADGFMARNVVVNGIKLNAKGRAVNLNSAARYELKLMCTATKFVWKHTKPAYSKSKKMRVCFNWLVKHVPEHSTRRLHNVSGWWRPFASQVFYRNYGDCRSFAAAYAYIANAIGNESVLIVSDTGHCWCEVDGYVYDPEWSKNGHRIYKRPLSKDGAKGIIWYKNCRVIIVTISERTKLWKSSTGSDKKTAKPNKNGLVKKNGAWYYYSYGTKVKSKWIAIGGKRYWFRANGKAATGAFKVKGTWYVFSEKGVLQRGSKTRLVKVAGVTYRVTKSGKAKAGWTADHTKRYLATGELATGVRCISGMLWAFSGEGAYDAEYTAQLHIVCTFDADASALVSLMGKSRSRKAYDSCAVRMGTDGTKYGGKDVVYKYAHVIVGTFACDDGVEYLSYVQSR